MWYCIGMIEIEKSFTWGGGGFGQNVRHFKQLKRNRLFAIYERSDSNGKIDGYEVIKIHFVKKGTYIPMFKKTYLDDTEFYPSTSQWGTNGFSLLTLKDAENKFEQLSKQFII